MPALVNSRVGSSLGSRDEEGTSRCPRATKKSRKSRRMSAERIRENIPTANRRPLTAQRGVHRLDGIPAGKPPPSEKRQEPSAFDWAGQAAEVGRALGGEGGRERPPVV